MYDYTAIVNYFDKNMAERTIRKTVKAKNMKAAKRKLAQLGIIKNITWEKTPDIAADRQLELFSEENY